MSSKKIIFVKTLKFILVMVSLAQLVFFTYKLFSYDEIPVFNDFSFTEKWVLISIITMILGSITSIFLEFLGALIMLLGYAIKIFTDGIEYNLFFDSFIVISFFNFLIFYLKNHDKSR